MLLSQLRRALPCLALSLCLCLVSLQTLSQPTAPGAYLPPPTDREAWLVSYGPGEIYWQRFGHNAIWLREPGGLDHTFNFGFFDFEQENFFLRFVQGRMLYFAAVMPAERELALYAAEGREVRIQRLELDDQAYARLREHLLRKVQPANRDYLYDYYLDNCSTRIRDALDLALGGRLASHFQELPAQQTLRAHTRRSTQADRDYYFGLVAALGWPVDRPINRWTEHFLPARLAEDLASFQLGPAGQKTPFVTEDRILIPGTVPVPAATPGRTWHWYLAWALGLLTVNALLLRGPLRRLGQALVLGWLTLAGLLGVAMLVIWGFTDHAAANPNANLLLLQPWLLLAWLRPLRRVLAASLLAGCLLALLLALWPGGQYLADTLALFGMLNLGAAAWLWSRHRRRPATGNMLLKTP